MRWLPALLSLDFQTATQFGREHALGQLLLELAGQPPPFAQDQLGILTLNLGKQLIDQLIGKTASVPSVLALLGHCCIGHRTLAPLSSHDLSTKNLTGSG